MQNIEYRIIFSGRKTLAVEVNAQAQVIVRAPFGTSQRKIRTFLDNQQEWICRHVEKMEQKQAQQDEEFSEMLTQEQLRALGQQAAQVLTQRTVYYAQQLGVTYGRITIRCQKSRWGSCSARGNLNYNCLLMLAPAQIQDYVVVHELCHRLEMNHSDRFWAQVERILPDWKSRRKWLRDNGQQLMMRAHGS